MSNRLQFSTQSEAERAIAELGKAGLLKPTHLPGSYWVLTVNREGTISRSQLFHLLCVELERQGQRIHPHAVQIKANEIWAAAKRSAKRRTRGKSGR